MGLRLKLLGGAVAAAAVVAGGGRLVHDEVRLTEGSSRVEDLRDRLSLQEDEALRASRLELELSQAQVRLGEVESHLGTARQAAARLKDALADAEAARARVAERADAAEGLAQERAEALERVEALAQERAQVLERVAALLEERSRALEEVRALATARAEALEAAEARQARLETREAELQGQLADARRAAAARGEEVAALQGRLDDVRQELAEASARARRSDDLLAALRGAGINVERKAGLDPVPPIQALVVRVDEEAVPPIVLVDAGSEGGLQLGDELFVIRDGREVARLEVEELHRRLSASRVVQGRRGLRLRPGDRVVSRPPGAAQR